MFRRMFIGAVVVFVALSSGCASIPMASKEQDTALKQFTRPAGGKAGLYIFRNSFVGQALKKTVSIDGVVIGETAIVGDLFTRIEEFCLREKQQKLLSTLSSTNHEGQDEQTLMRELGAVAKEIENLKKIRNTSE